MRQTNRSVPPINPAPKGQAQKRTTHGAPGKSPVSHFGASLAAVALALVVVACGGPAERPDTQEVAGTTEYMVSEAGAGRSGSACEHGSVVECKVWITDVDCFTGLAVCDHGQLSGCMDPDSAEAALEAMDEAVE